MLIIKKYQLIEIEKRVVEFEMRKISNSTLQRLRENFYIIDDEKFNQITTKVISDFKKYKINNFDDKCSYLYVSYIFNNSVFSMHEFYSEMLEYINSSSNLNFMTNEVYIKNKIN